MKRIRVAVLAVIVPLLIAFGLSPAQATDFHILLTFQTPAERLGDPPVGTILINGGYEHGIEAGQTGALWELGSYREGGTKLGTVVVQSVDATEATCSVIMDDAHPMISKEYRVSIDPIPEESPLLLEMGEAAYSAGDFERALFYFEKLWWVHQDNPLVRQRTESCRYLVDSARQAGPSLEEQQLEMRRLDRLADIAHRYIKIHDLPMADRYLERLMAIDSTNPRVMALKLMIPEDKVFSPLHTDCYPRPAFNDSTESDYSVDTLQWERDILPVRILLGLSCDSSRYALLVDRHGKLTGAVTLVSSGSSDLDWAVIWRFSRTDFDPVVVDDEPVCTWKVFHVAFPEPPRDSLLADYFKGIVLEDIDLTSDLGAQIFFLTTRNRVQTHRYFYPPETDPEWIQRKVDSILYVNYPDPFKSKFWKAQNNRPDYFGEWKKKRRGKRR